MCPIIGGKPRDAGLTGVHQMKSDTAGTSATLVSGTAEASPAAPAEGAEPSAPAAPSPATRTLILRIDPTDPDLTALAIIRLPVPSDERFLDPAVMRRALLDDSFARVGATLDVDQMARELMDVIVPHFCTSAGVSVMESLIGADEMPADALDSSHLLRRLAVGYDDSDPAWEATFPTGEV